MKKENQEPVIIRLLQDLGDTTNLHAYVVDVDGKVVEATPFDGKEAKLISGAAALRGENKVYIAQAMPKELADKANERMLMKAGAYEVVKNISGNFIEVYKIPQAILTRPWFYNNCLITGHVNKNFNIDGQVRNQPVCNARVHICEIETELIWPHIPIYKRRIPDWVINEIGEKFKHIHEVIIVPPVPDTIGPVSQLKRNVALRSFNKNNRLQESAKVQSLPSLQDHVLSAMTSGSIATIRKAMINYHEILYPYLCLWPIYWPYIYTCDEETIVYTDCNGHFEMWENTLTEDGPLNIYIWVEVWINGQWVTVYRPPIPCYTWWNYACGTDINIRVTDSRVNPCDCGLDGPADAVWFRSIGQSASALHIEQNAFNTITLQGATLKNGGCTDIIEGQKISPFGSGLALKLFCGADIFAAGVTHYRWKTTMVANAAQNPVVGSPTFITGNVSRPYLVKISTTHYETHYCSLGNEGSNIDPAYRIPHHDVNAEPASSLQDPVLDPGRSPEWTDIFFDSAYIDSHSLTDGVYKFELELLKKVGSNFVVVPVAKPTYQISEYNTIGNNQDAPNNYLNINAGDNTKADSYKMNVRIDNAACTGDIHDAQLKETGDLSGPCGFIHYGDTGQHIHISFEASHPRNFARFSFGIVKGNGSQPTDINPSGYVLSSVGGFTLATGLFSADFTVLSLLNGCIGQAAFSENLHVAALATDGTNRLYGFDYHDIVTNTNINYDAYDVKAFALSNT